MKWVELPQKCCYNSLKAILKPTLRIKAVFFISNITIKISWFDVDQTKMIAQFFCKGHEGLLLALAAIQTWLRHVWRYIGKKMSTHASFFPAKWHLLKMPKGICLAGFSSCFCWNKIDIWMKRLRRTCVLLFLNCYPGVSVEKAPPITGMDYYCYCSRTEKFMTFPAILFCHFQCVWPFPQKILWFE